MIYFCCEENRRSLAREHPVLNGIDYLEVVDSELTGTSDEPFRQRRLRVSFVRPPAGSLLARLESSPPDFSVKVTGGTAHTAIRVDKQVFDPATGILEITLDRRGDYSRYTLALQESNTENPLAELDPMLAAIDFSFKVECESDFDCRSTCNCPPQVDIAPDLDYLAKDYSSFRQMMFDRMAVLVPEWRERNPADLGVTLVELLAYLGDYLSYRQDAVATEAYLGTARKRISVRRHARLLDYPMHDGCNARVWVQIRVKQGEPGSIVHIGGGDEQSRPRLVTRLAQSSLLGEFDFERLRGAGNAEVFELLERADLLFEHNEFLFYTWGDVVCCLPQGAVKATLLGHHPNLQPGQVLILAERLSPESGAQADANPLHRHPVRLTRVNGLDRDQYLAAKQDHSLSHRQDPLIDPPADITEIEWSEADSLPFPLCLSARPASTGRLLTNVSHALGNIVLADHGMTLTRGELLDRVPAPNPALAPVGAAHCGHCDKPKRIVNSSRYRPQLGEQPLTRAATYDPSRAAAEAFRWRISNAVPAIFLLDDRGRRWEVKADLLSSDRFAPEFVAETESDGRTYLRFGDDENGMSPGEGTLFEAVYRRGNGVRGNVGAGAIYHFVADRVVVTDGSGNVSEQPSAQWIDSVTNPMPARGGMEPESLENVRQNAPVAFRQQQRAVTPLDYAQKAGEHPEVQRAAATWRWTGSWHTIFLSVDRRSGRSVDAAFEQDLRAFLERYRMAGHDLEIHGPRYVFLELEIQVCVAMNYFHSDVVVALQKEFDNRRHADGSLGFFHPDKFTFGQPVFLSRIYAAAQGVAGVRHVEVTVLRRQGDKAGEVVPSKDLLEIGPLEIARLDNDPNFPDRGVLRLNAAGGR